MEVPDTVLPRAVLGILQKEEKKAAQADPRQVFDVLRRGISSDKDVEDCEVIFTYLHEKRTSPTRLKKVAKLDSKALASGLITAKACVLPGEDDYV